MTEYTLVLPGPKLTMEDLRPYAIKKDKQLSCSMPGLVGLVFIDKYKNRMDSPTKEYLAIQQKRGKASIDFTRGESVVLVKVEGRYVIVTRKFFESRKREIVLVGS